MDKQFSHVDERGRLRMVDISEKSPTQRRAVASCVVRTHVDITSLAAHASGVDPLHAARLAGIQAAKQTSSLIPLCHPLDLSDIHVEVTAGPSEVIVVATVAAMHRTGVEMEALTACAVAGLSVLNALVDADPGARMDDLVLLRKSGGKSGPWGRLVTSS